MASEGYENILIFIPLAIVVSAHRALRIEAYTNSTPRTELEAVTRILRLVSLCKYERRDGVVILTSLLSKHITKCHNSTCDCRLCYSKASGIGTNDPMILNYQAVKTEKDLPKYFKNNWKLRVFIVLLADISKKFGKCDEVLMLIAQIFYFYLGNHYNALVMIAGIESRNPPMLTRIQLFYIRHIINIGLLHEAETQLQLIESLQYQSHFKKFLKVADEVAECTIKFWATLLHDVPDMKIMNTIGVTIFKLRRRLLSICDDINKICKNNFEFLIKYGLYMRVIVNDFYSASTAYSSIMRSMDKIRHGKTEENTFSILESEERNMMIEISLETKDLMQIVDVNAEAEIILKASRAELIGKPLANIMPPMIADIHEKAMQQFFKTMVSKVIDTKQTRLIKNHDGVYIFCSMVKHIVPTLVNGFRGIMFAHVDKKIEQYTKNKKDPTSRKYGAIICDESMKILGFNTETSQLLDIPELLLTEILCKNSLETIFPEVDGEKGTYELLEPYGRVLEFKKKGLLEIDAEGGNDWETNKADDQAGTLMWARLIKETYFESSTCNIFIFAPINAKYVKRYARIQDSKFFKNIARGKQRGKKFDIYDEVKKGMIENKGETSNTFEDEKMLTNTLSQSESNSASKFSSTNMTGTSSRSSLIGKELLDRALANETPSSITKLGVAIIALFFVVIALISIFFIWEKYKIAVDVFLVTNEANLLNTYMILIEAYEGRFAHTMNLVTQASFYNLTRDGSDQSGYAMSVLRMEDSMYKMIAINVEIRKTFALLKLDYDSHMIEVTEKDEDMTISFSHAIIKVFFHHF